MKVLIQLPLKCHQSSIQLSQKCKVWKKLPNAKWSMTEMQGGQRDMTCHGDIRHHSTHCQIEHRTLPCMQVPEVAVRLRAFSNNYCTVEVTASKDDNKNPKIPKNRTEYSCAFISVWWNADCSCLVWQDLDEFVCAKEKIQSIATLKSLVHATLRTHLFVWAIHGAWCPKGMPKTFCVCRDTDSSSV